jgi:hypothetical protein
MLSGDRFQATLAEHFMVRNHFRTTATTQTKRKR